MPPTLQVGAVLIEARPAMTKLLGLESEPYSGKWSLVTTPNGFALDRIIHAAGWNFFFMAAEFKVMFFGARRADRIHSALTRIIGKVRGRDFNCLEVTGIVAKRFLGMPYTMVSAHSRHIQQSVYMDCTKTRKA